jgi:hypothetical protein
MITTLENNLNNFLQRDVNFICNSKSIKKGKLLLFTIKDFYITFMLRVNNEQKKFELPYPFFSETKGLTAEMNYSLNEIAHNCDHLYFKLKSITPKTNAKIYDNVVYIVGE